MLEMTREGFLQAAAGGPSLVDLDGTFVIQLVIFLVFAVLLNLLLIKPVMAAQAKRFASMDGARGEAEAMDLEAAKAFEDYESRIDEARRASVTVRDELRDAALDKARELVEAARESADAALARGRQDLAAQAAKTRAEMEAEVETLAQLVADRALAEGGKA